MTDEEVGLFFRMGAGIVLLQTVAIGFFVHWGNTVGAVTVAISLSIVGFSMGRMWQQRNDLRAARHKAASYARSASTTERGEGMYGASSAGPSAAADAISTCVECLSLLDDTRRQAKHQGRLVERCLECAVHSLCPANPLGPHEHVVWPEDPAYDLERVGDIPGPLPTADQRIGYCDDCLQPFRQRESGRFHDLTWELVGLMWAEHRGVSQCREVEAMIVMHHWRGGGTQLELRLAGSDGKERYVRETNPFSDPDSLTMQLLRLLDYGDRDPTDLDVLLGVHVVVQLDMDGQVSGWRKVKGA